MEIRLTVPEEFLSALVPEGHDASRTALEAFGLEAYRQRRMSGYQLRRLLDIESRFELDAFLKMHQVETYTVADLEQDIETLRLLKTPSAA